MGLRPVQSLSACRRVQFTPPPTGKPVDKFSVPRACILLAEFNVPSFHSEHELSPAFCHYCEEIEERRHLGCTCLLGLYAQNHFIISGDLLDLLLFQFY